MKRILVLIGIVITLTANSQNVTIVGDTMIIKVVLPRASDSLIRATIANIARLDSGFRKDLSEVRRIIPIPVDQSFETLPYSPALSVSFSSVRPNKTVNLTGDIAITNTTTVNGSSGLYLVSQDAAGNHAFSINGKAININPKGLSETVVTWIYSGSKYSFGSNYLPIIQTTL